MFFEDVVKNLSMDVIKVRPREFGAVNACEHVERPYSPIDGELFDVDIGFLFVCQPLDFVFYGSSPVEHCSADIPG